MSFDPKMRARSIAQTPKASNSGNAGEIVGHLSSILHDVRVIMTGDTRSSNPFATPSCSRLANDITPAAMPFSPPQYSPSKLPAFLKYAEENLGIKNAMTYEASLELNGYGPDILSSVNDDAIVACGITPGDAIHLKRGAEQWWRSPEAKRVRTVVPRPPSPPPSIRFIMKYHVGGSMSVHGTGVQDGDNPMANDYDWWYYNRIMRREEKLPDGKVPILDEEFHDDPNIFPPE